MKTKLLFNLLLICSISSWSQAPFKTVMREYVSIVATQEVDGKGVNFRKLTDEEQSTLRDKSVYLEGDKVYNELRRYDLYMARKDYEDSKNQELSIQKSEDQSGLVAAQKVSIDKYKIYTNLLNELRERTILSNIREADKDPLTIFDNSGFSLNFVKTNETRMSAKTEVLHYKLYFLDPSEGSDKKERWNMPFLFLTKLSSNYDSISAASSLDVLDYDPAPITIRIMPSFSYEPDNYKSVFYFGTYLDARGINLSNPSTNNHTIEFVGSGGIGFTFEGFATASKLDENSEYKDGKFSFSAMLQAATGKKEVIQSLFDTDKDYITSFQTFLIIKLIEAKQLNIKVGYQYFFKNTIAGNHSNFSLTIGL